MLFEQKKQHLWHSCCPISLVISNMKFNCKLSEQFWRIWCFPIQSDRSCTWMPERRFKDGRWVTWLALKRLWRYYQVSTAVSTDNLWPNHLRRMLLPGVNVALQTRDSCCIHTLPQHINMIRQMKGTHLSWRGRQQAENERNEAKASRRLREIGWETECESDGWNWCTQTRENFRSSTFQGSPVTLYLTISLSWCQRPTDLVICKLYFEREGGEASTKKKEEMLDQGVISPYYHRRSVRCTLTAWFSMRANITFSICVRVALAVVWLMRFLLAR